MDRRVKVVMLLLLIQGVAGSLVISRELPSSAAPGENITIVLVISGSPSGGVIIRESLPPGWRVVGSEPAGYFSPGEALIKWVFPGGPPERIAYTLAVPRNARGEYTINGSWVTLAGEGEVPPSLLRVEQRRAVEQGISRGAAALALAGGALLLYLLGRRRR
ncbi:MAG: hypothetical protein GXO66_01865 [Euryarchaeota archaeon]|nr:hypothetical protein [Euryarchaeota archaeon]